MSPFSIHIFVSDGDPDGLRIVNRDNWIGKGLIFPRSLLPKIKHRSEFSMAGVYLLIGPRPDGEGEMLYIGEGDPIKPRLESHFSQKDFWTKAVFFVAGTEQLNKAHIQYIESQLIQKAKAAKKFPLENANSPTEPSLSEADKAYMQVFLENMLGILPVLGVGAFEASPIKNNLTSVNILNCTGKGVSASGFESNQGFVVRQGSRAALDTAPSMKEHVRGMYDLRMDLISNGVLLRQGDMYTFSQDYTFSSPSTAAAIVLGRSANGRVEWKDQAGKTLKDIQDSIANSVSE